MSRKLCILVFGLLAIHLAQAQVATISASTTVGCAPLIVVFKDATPGGSSSWSWSFPGGAPNASIASGANVTFNNPGTYTVTLTINGGGSPNLTTTQQIKVLAPPSANFTVAGDTIGCYPFPVHFLSQAMPGGAPIVKYNWGFGDGVVSDLMNPFHTYLTAANFPVTLQVIDANGCSNVASITHYINISGGVTASFSTIASSGCSLPVTIQLNNTSTGVPGFSNIYTWTFGDGSAASHQISPPHTYNASGNYNIILVAQSPAGCMASDTVPTQITGGNVSSSFQAPDSICVNSTVKFQNTSTPAPVVSNWTFGDGTSSDSINAVKTYSIPGSYPVNLINIFGACIDSISRQITVLTPAIANFMASSTVSCDSLFTVNFTDQSTGASNWSWNFNDGSPTSNQPNPTHTFKGYGTRNVTLTVSNAANCGGTITKTIQNQKPYIALSNLNSQGCAPFSYSPVLIDTVVDGIKNYFWDFNNGTTSTSANPPVQLYPNAGTYIVKLTITTNGGCTVSTTETVKVGTIKPIVSFTATPDTVCTNAPITFTDNSGNNPNAWYWDFGDGSSSISPSPTHRYQVPNTFTVTLRAYNNGCNDSAKLNVKVNLPLANFTDSFSCLGNTRVFSFHDTSIGADTWFWNFGDGTTYNGQTPPPHIYPAIDTTYTATLTVSNASTGCFNMASQFISVVQGTASYISSAYNICNNSPIVISIFNIKNSVIYSYTYDFGDGTPVLTTLAPTLPHTYTKTGSYQVKVVLTEFNGCLDTLIDNRVQIHVAGPTAGFTTLKTIGCTGFTASFTDQSASDGVNPIKQWIWDFGDGTIQTYTGPPFTHNYSKQGIFTVKLKVIDASGCADSITKISLITIALPKAGFATIDSLSCPGSPIQFVNNSQGYGLTYTWYFGNNADTSNLVNPTYIYPIGTYKTSLKVTDQFGCTDSVGNYNILIDTPSASFTMIDTFASCPPLTADFKFTGSYYQTLRWTFGDGGLSVYPTNPNGLNPIYLYALPGIYTATLVVTSHGGCTDTARSYPIHILGPVGALNFTPDQGCHIVTVNFKLTTSNDVTNYLWLFNPSQSDSTKADSTSFTYDSIGIFHPAVVLRDSTGCNVLIQATDSVVVLGSKPKIWFNNNIVCGSGNVQFRDSSFTTGTLASWKWDFGDGDTSNIQNPLHFYALPGIYSVKLVVATQSNCQDSIIMNNLIKVVANPVIGITGDSEKCVPASMNFQGVILQPDTSAYKWKWNFANGNISLVQNPASQFYPIPGTDTVKLTATNSSNCSTTVSKIIKIDSTAITNAGPDTAICVGQTAFLHASSSASPAIYSWLPPTNNTLSCTNCSNPIATPGSTTSYYLQSTNTFGCGSVDTVVVTVVQPASMNVSPLDDSVCLGQSVQLTASGEMVYNWSPATGLSNPSIGNPIATPDTTTIYQVTGSDSLHCFSNTESLMVNVFPYPTVNLGPRNVTIPVGTSYQINGIGSADIDSINWSPTIGLSCANCLSPLASPTTTTTYVVKVENNGGCITADSIRIIVTCDGKNLFVPNTFSPNADGMNDWFFVQGTGLTTIQSLRIFNRWGELVFEKINFAPNVESEGWNGDFNGKKAPVDVYVYTIEVVCENSQVVAYHGNVALIR